MPKKYSDEFKADAVAVYLEHPGAPYKEIAADLELNSETLRGWVQASRKAPVTGGSLIRRIVPQIRDHRAAAAF
ncbi:transposase [Glycomyces sp. L485]|uniref:transposase n=1 Tax=Glycomyces sp. L485 TaxID=2909235 RepID=UPI001F4B50A9|nr:transposase [Glycomyces sp. L485]